MNIEEVLKMWKEDSIIDDLKLDYTTIKTARMHSKYLELITIAKIRKKKKDLDYKTLLKNKWLYYNGKLSKEEIRVCRKIGVKLVRDGLFFAGLDLIGTKLVEVNVLSPGAVTEFNRLNKTKLQIKIIDYLEKTVEARKTALAKDSDIDMNSITLD